MALRLIGGGCEFTEEQAAALLNLISVSPIDSLVANGSTINSITVEWVGQGDEFKVYYRSTGTISWVDHGNTTARNYTVPGLQGDTDYDIAVTVFLDGIESEKTIVTFATKPFLDFFAHGIYINLAGATTSAIMALTPDTAIYLNDLTRSNPPLRILNKGEVFTYNSSQFDTINFDFDKSIYIGGKVGSAVTWVPGTLTGNTYAFGVSRGDPQNLHIWAVEDTTVELLENGSVLQSLVLSADSGGTITWNAGSGDHSYLVSSTGLIIPFHHSRNVIDPKPLMPLSFQIIGTASTRGKLYTSAGLANVNYQESDATTGNLIAVAGGVTELPRSSSLFSGPSILLDSTELIAANSYADSNGSNNTPFLPLSFLRKIGGVPYSADFVKFFSNKACQINIFNGDGTPWIMPSITLNGSGNCYEFRITGISSPIYFESSDEFGYVWQDAPTNDETIGLIL